MSLQLRAAVDARLLDVDLSLDSGERIAVLGPNGAGKSTLLAVIAGVLRPDRGHAELDGDVLFSLEGGRRVFRPPYARGVALMAQDPLLFPHLSALENVAFGPRSAGRGRGRSREVARHWLDEVGMTELADRRPAQLSGGQAQRVAIARALAAEPRLLLLDEPMAALDVGAAPLLRRVLGSVLADRAAVIVTHDLLDALLLAQRVVVLDQGRVVEQGPTNEVLQHPRTPFTARLAGLNLVRGTAEADGVRSLSGPLVIGVPRLTTTAGDPAVAVFGPSAVAVHNEPPGGSPRNVLPVVLTTLEPRDEQVRIRARTGQGQSLVADVTAAAVGELDLYPGKPAWFAVKATSVTIYPG